MKKVLLSLAAVGTALSANAQLLNYGFETSNTLPGEVLTTNWENWNEAHDTNSFANCAHEVQEDSDDASNHLLYAFTDVTAGAWQRVYAFTQLGLNENTSYRIEAKVKATSEAKFNLALLKGCFDHDAALQGGKIGGLVDQTKDFTVEDADTWVTYSYVVWSPSREIMASKKADLEQDEYWYQDFLRLSFNGIGTYYVDDLKVFESNIQAIDAKEDVICVDFGYETSAKELAGTTAYYLKNEDVTVSIAENAEATPATVKIFSAELHDDGKLYIFLDKSDANYAAIEEGNIVKVSFNSTDEKFKYTGTTNPNAEQVLSFVNEEARYNDNLSAASALTTEPVLVSSNPLDESFGYDGDFTSFSFTFDKKVVNNDDWAGAPKATLTGNGLNEVLTFVENAEPTETIVFNRPAGAEKLANGDYTITVKDVTNTYASTTSEDMVITFSIGTVKVAKTNYNKVGQMFVPSTAEGSVPEGWLIVTNNEHRTSENKYYSGGRCFNKAYGSGAYFRGNEGEEAYVLTAPCTLPAGNITLRAYVSSWKNESHKVTIKVLDADSTVVAKADSVATTALYAEGGDKNYEFQEIEIKFNATAGDYRLLFIENTLNGNGLFIKGGEFIQEETIAGDVFVPDTIARGDFSTVQSDYTPAHGTGWKIYRSYTESNATAWKMRDAGANCNWGGNCWTGGGGTRCKSVGNKGFGGGAIYLGGNCYATYGEFEVQTDHDRNPILDEKDNTKPEKVLEVAKKKYQVTYYILAWKAANQNVKFEIFPFDEGTSGTPVYTRTDAINENSGSGNNSSVAAKKIQFFWDVRVAGKYIVKVTSFGDGEGETLFGNFTIESVAPFALQYAQTMEQNLKPAKEELALALESDNYAGETRDALDAIIKYNDTPKFHTVAEYEAEFTKISNLIKASQLRRSNIDSYPTCLQGILDGMNAAEGTKYENLVQFPTVKDAYNTYKDVDYIALNDADLNEAVEAMGSTGTLLSNLVNTCVPLLTKQLVDLANAIVELDDNAATEDCILAAANALEDDQEIASQLKKLYTAKLYAKIAYSKLDFFKTVVGEDTVDYTIPANFLIQNAGFYCVGPTTENAGSITIKEGAFPGWTINKTNGNYSCCYNTQGWGGAYPTDVKPVENCALRTGWGSSDFTVEQLINDLPIVKYTASLTIGEDGSDHESFAYCGKDTVAYEAESYSRDESTPRTFENVAPVVNKNDTLFGSITLGASMHVVAGFINVDNATLTMTGKVEGFDYVAAAKALGEEATGIQAVKRTDAPTAESYYNLAGQRINAAEGVCIKIERYSDGYTVVKKVTVK